MSEHNLFEIASRKGYRFQTPKGQVTTEDLWELPLTVLDVAYREHNKALRSMEEDSLLQRAKTPVVTELTNKRDLIQYVVMTRLQENEAKEAAKARKEKAARVRELLAQKEEASLAAQPAEELRKLLEELEAQ